MEFEKNVSLKHLNSFAVPAVTNELFRLESVDQLAALIPLIKHKQKRLVLGGGTNILLRDDFPGLVVLNRLKGKSIVGDNQHSVRVRVSAGEDWHDFVCWCIDQQFHGLENLSLIPGSVGAAPIQNIGAYGVELEQCFDSLTAIDLDAGKTESFDTEQCEFGYRESFFKTRPDQYLIISVTFNLSKCFTPMLGYKGIKEKLKQHGADINNPGAKEVSNAICELRNEKLPLPGVIGNAGSFFKNPVIDTSTLLQIRHNYPCLPSFTVAANEHKIPAAWLIEQCGWKGYRASDTGVYEKHALVLVNHRHSSGAEIWNLARRIQKSVEQKFTIVLQPEPRVL